MATLQRQGARAGHSAGAFLIPVGIAFALQLALAPHVEILGGRFNFMVAVACAMAPGLPAGSAAVLGFSCGMLYDLSASVPVGLMSLILTVACFALSSASNGVSLGSSAEGIRLTGTTAVGVIMAYATALLVMGVEGDILAALFGHGLTTGILSALASLPFLLFASVHDASPGFSAKPRGRGHGRGTRFKGVR